MYCKHCGKEIADDSKFCNHCGKPQNKRSVNFKSFFDKETKIVLAVLIIVTVSFFIAANSNLRPDIASLLGIEDNSQVEDSPSIEPTNPQTDIEVMNETVAYMKVKAEVFRLVNGYYKDANRKEEILIAVDSNGSFHLSYDFNRFTCVMGAIISSIRGYEYEIWCVEKSGVKIVYAFNEDEMQKIDYKEGLLKEIKGKLNEK